MPDREKVIKGLECCSSMNGYACAECPYSSECVGGEAEYQVGTAHLAGDALTMLKEQETGHWVLLENCSNFGVYCSECQTKVFDNYPFKKKFSYFCPHCGTRMEGEIERR